MARATSLVDVCLGWHSFRRRDYSVVMMKHDYIAEIGLILALGAMVRGLKGEVMVSIAILTLGFVFGGALYIWWHRAK